LANLTNSQEPKPEPVGAGCFWLLGAGAGGGAAWEKNQEPEPLEKKSGAGKKFAGSPALLSWLLPEKNKHISCTIFPMTLYIYFVLITSTVLCLDHKFLFFQFMLGLLINNFTNIALK